MEAELTIKQMELIHERKIIINIEMIILEILQYTRQTQEIRKQIKSITEKKRQLIEEGKKFHLYTCNIFWTLFHEELYLTGEINRKL